MQRLLLLFACLAVMGGGCRKAAVPTDLSTTDFVPYTIEAGQHFATGNNLRAFEGAALRMTVRFDRSAVYQTANPENQYDVNKLFGFSDNGEPHHRSSARFGWRWSDGALRLFAYTYLRGQRQVEELGTVAIGVTLHCALAVQGNRYLFNLNGRTVTMPRESEAPMAQGYRLYPYFGGDEPAPHAVRIWMREEVSE